MAPFPRLMPFGEAAWLVELGDGVDEALSARVQALAARVEAARDGRLAGVGRPVPAYGSLLVTFDGRRIDAAALRRALVELAREALTGPVEAWPDDAATEIEVRYGGEDGPDLAAVARATGLAAARVVELHAGVTYRVLMLGFVPGFAYLGTLPSELELPRRAEPRLRVPAGSVAIAGRQTTVYPFATPGGWHLIGRTDRTLWDAGSDPPARLRPGDRVRFVPAG
jgi:KipI family sensor histidine kinase inhibitor